MVDMWGRDKKEDDCDVSIAQEKRSACTEKQKPKKSEASIWNALRRLMSN